MTPTEIKTFCKIGLGYSEASSEKTASCTFVLLCI